jgi:hypothetical protein
MKIGRMMHRFSFVVFLVLSGIQTARGGNSPVDVLIKNKAIFIKNILACSTATKCPENRCFVPMRDTLIKLLQSQNLKDAAKLRIAILYFSVSRSIIYANSSRAWFNDSIDFNFLIEALHADTDFLAVSAGDLLAERSDITTLRNYRDKIKQALSRSSFVSMKRKIHILALASKTVESIKDTSGIENAVRKYMIDTESENEMIATLDTNPLYYEKLWAIHDLSLKGNRRCLQALILHFNEPCFSWSKRNEFAPACTSATLRIPIIQYMGRYYPNESLLNDSLYALLYCPEKSTDRKYIALYFDRFLRWAKKELGVEPKDPALPSMIGETCRYE